MAKLIYPRYVYHGTTRSVLDNMIKPGGKLIDPTYWNPQSDFGAGFYTTIDIDQAQTWAIEAAKNSGDLDDTPCVLWVAIVQREQIQQDTLVFIGSSEQEWANFILTHRNPKTGTSPCSTCAEEHPIVVGPMARGRIHDAVNSYLYEGQDLERFYNEIRIINNQGPVSDLRLGNQITFCNPSLAEEVLLLAGFTSYNFEKEVWSDVLTIGTRKASHS